MNRRRALLFLGGLLAVLVAAAIFLRRDLTAAYYVYRLHHARDWRLRANAAIELGRLKVRRSANDLVKRLNDTSVEVRKNCEWALAEVTGWPWGIERGPAPDWWNKHGRDFIAGRQVPDLPRVSLPEATGGGQYLEISARLAEDRVYRLGPEEDMMTVVVSLRNTSGRTLTVLHPAWESYEAYLYQEDGSKTPVDVRHAPPSSVLLEASRTGRTLSGPIERPIWQFSTLPDELPATEPLDLEFQIVVSRDRPDVLFEAYRFDVRVNDAVLGTTEGLVTERASASTLRAWAWASGKEVLEQLGLEAQEVARSGRELIGVLWGEVAEAASRGELGEAALAHGASPLLPKGTLGYSKASGWVVVHSASPDQEPALLPLNSPGVRKEGWIFVVKGP